MNENEQGQIQEQAPLDEYEPPTVLTLDAEAILEELGPARACYGFTDLSL